MKNFLKRLKSKFSPNKDTPPAGLRQTGSHPGLSGTESHRILARRQQAVPDHQPKAVEVEPHIEGHIDEHGPGKNVLIGNKHVGEDEDADEKLKLVDNPSIESDKDAGFDPYDTGQFDTSKIWDKHFRK